MFACDTGHRYGCHPISGEFSLGPNAFSDFSGTPFTSGETERRLELR